MDLLSEWSLDPSAAGLTAAHDSDVVSASPRFASKPPSGLGGLPAVGGLIGKLANHRYVPTYHESSLDVNNKANKQVNKTGVMSVLAETVCAHDKLTPTTRSNGTLCKNKYTKLHLSGGPALTASGLVCGRSGAVLTFRSAVDHAPRS